MIRGNGIWISQAFNVVSDNAESANGLFSLVRVMGVNVFEVHVGAVNEVPEANPVCRREL